MIEKCVALVRHSKIKVQEGCRSAVILNANGEEFRRIQVDGCVDVEGPKADWVIERDARAVIIELKGRGVEHGAAQVLATAELWTRKLKRCAEVCGLIVGAMPPRARGSMQVRQDRFARAFKAPLHVVRANSEYEFGHLFSFKGPFKE